MMDADDNDVASPIASHDIFEFLQRYDGDGVSGLFAIAPDLGETQARAVESHNVSADWHGGDAQMCFRAPTNESPQDDAVSLGLGDALTHEELFADAIGASASPFVALSAQNRANDIAESNSDRSLVRVCVCDRCL